MSTKNYIKIKNLSKSFGDVEVLKNINLEVEEGEFFSLLGPSGCGKTTLLRILAGFEYPSEGEVFFDDANVTSLPPNLRPSNMVFQNYAIFPHINVQRNIEFGLRKENLSKAEMGERVENALKMVQLEGYENRYSNQLSGGQRQRIALARALVKQPKVLLLDEPLGALDKKLREEMQIELRNLQKSLGITFIFVTHDQEEAMTMSDRIAVMDEGNILQVSPPREIYHNPKNKFVSQFIGNINIRPTYIDNFDIRYESFGEKSQLFALSLFYKKLTDPIEIGFVAAATSNYKPLNLSTANVIGAEIEIRKKIETFFSALKNLTLIFNGSIINSKEKFSADEIKLRTLGLREGETIGESRPLQGQSPYLINAGIDYNSDLKNLQVGIYYNVQGKTLEFVGNGFYPDVYTMPFQSLNFNLIKNLKKNRSITFKISNLLDDDKESFFQSYKAEDKYFKFRNPGRSFSLGYSISF